MENESPAYHQKSQSTTKQETKNQDLAHGYVRMTDDNKELLVPPGQLGIEGLSKPDDNFDVGKRTYQFQGDAMEIIDYLEKNAEMTFSAHTLGSDGNWGVGKDTENQNLKVCIADMSSEPVKNHLQQATENIGTFAKKAIGPPSLGEIAGAVTEGKEAIIAMAEALPNPSEKIGNPQSIVSKALLSKTAAKAKPEGMSAIVQKTKFNLNKVAKSSGLKELPLLGDQLKKVLHTNVIVSINPYNSPKQSGISTIDLGKPTCTFAELAQTLKEQVYAIKQTEKETAPEQEPELIAKYIDPDTVKKQANPEGLDKGQSSAESGNVHNPNTSTKVPEKKDFSKMVNPLNTDQKQTTPKATPSKPKSVSSMKKGTKLKI